MINEISEMIKNEAVNLYVRSLGAGMPLIVIHGGPGLSQDYLLPWMERLADDYQVIFYDQRSCGNSTGPINSQTITIENFISDIDFIRKKLGFEKVSILGHSFGGFLAMHYAIAYSQHVDKLILANSFPPSSEEVTAFVQEWLLRNRENQTFYDNMLKSPEFLEGNPDAVALYYRTIFRTYCYLPESADLLNLFLSPQAARNGQKVYELLKSTLFEAAFNLHVPLKNTHIPLLIIHGEHDVVPPTIALNLHKKILHSQLKLIEKCGHFPYIENPKPFYSVINQFLKNK